MNNSSNRSSRRKVFSLAGAAAVAATSASAAAAAAPAGDSDRLTRDVPVERGWDVVVAGGGPAGAIRRPSWTFTDDPAENVTLHVRGRWSKAMLACPGCAPKALQLDPVLDATAVQIHSLPAFAAVRVKQ